MNFTFLDYLTLLEHTFKQAPHSMFSKSKLNEVTELKEHRATITTMQRHLKHYKALKFIVENFDIQLGNC